MFKLKSLSMGALLTSLVAFGAVSTDMYLPALPMLTQYFNTDVATVQLTYSMFMVGYAVAQLAYGPLSDRFGRRWVLLAGLAIYVLASVACVFATSIEQLIVARFAQALGACAGPVIARAIVHDIHGREGSARVLAYMATVMGLLPALASVAGGFITAEFGWQGNFVALVIFSGGILAATAWGLPETNKAKDATATQAGELIRTYLGLMLHRRYMGYAMCISLTYSSLVLFVANSSFVLINYAGIEVSDFGFYFGPLVFGFMIGAFLSGRYTRRLGADRMIVWGLWVMAALGIVVLSVTLTGTREPWFIVLPVIPFLLGMGFVFPNAMGQVLGLFNKRVGAASALVGFFQMAIAAALTTVIGLLSDGTPIPMAWGMLGTALLASVCYFFLARPRPQLVTADASQAE
jgi:DHA1 family bicyclomycin/chloramphenicol resistance-like MFS transporter